ncbi:tetratricopeptide repeat protein [Leifsonia sp. ZF2019]|uniref:tetratricopeptide repeat protein n=1 Tax=Leifsonia sp. ZF2019 TaxID=2781978 RepID=UPI001CBDE18E|nr:tetratricopeptide repeat protein [Leifsonia sp. ZF2019]UAJ81242.1 tetratricopeptide repeat protein [Leifsonia sp. ZF2019]
MDDWQRRVDAAWDAADDRGEAATVAAILALAAERPAGDAAALYESAGAYDYAGREAEAEPLYRAALDAGLAEPERSRATIQLASTLRNLDRPEEAVELLRDLLAAQPAGAPLAGDAHAFAALALFDLGLKAEALREALTALAPHASRYGRAISAYAAELDDA